MRKPILSIAVLIIITAACFASPAAAQEKQLRVKLPKMRDIKIYVLQKPARRNSSKFRDRLVPVRRRIIDYEPLNAALKLLMISTNEAEKKRGLKNFMLGVEFYSARVRNRTAEINFVFHNQEIALGGWESGEFDPKNFVRAVELTARQFPGIERVSICLDGFKANRYFDSGGDAGKCLFPMFAPSAPRVPAADEVWDVKIFLNHEKAALLPMGVRDALPIKRRVKAADFLNETLNAFDAGPTAAERKQGWSSANYGVRFVSAQIKNRKAVVNFTMPPGARFPDRHAPLEFSFAVNDTVLQFWNEIEDIEICLDGNRNFYAESNEFMPCGEDGEK